MNFKENENDDAFGRGDVEGILKIQDAEILRHHVINAALNWGDRMEIERLCEQLSCHPNDEVRGNAILGLGHIARRFLALSIHFKKLIEEGLRDKSWHVRGQASAAASDANFFLKWDIETEQPFPATRQT